MNPFPFEMMVKIQAKCMRFAPHVQKPWHSLKHLMSASVPRKTVHLFRKIVVLNFEEWELPLLSQEINVTIGTFHLVFLVLSL